MNTERLLIIGARSAIGSVLIERFAAKHPATLIAAHARNLSHESTSVNPGPNINWYECDLSDVHAVKKMGEIFVNLAWIPSSIVFLPGLPLRYERLTKFDFDFFERDLAVQVHAPIVLLKSLLPSMQKLPSARIVFVNSSVTRGLPPKHLSMYAIVKHAQLGLMKSIASEYSGSCIRANAVSPSMLNTKFLKELPSSFLDGVAQAMPMRRNVDIDAVVRTIELLLGPAGDSITGVEIPVAGGSVI